MMVMRSRAMVLGLVLLNALLVSVVAYEFAGMAHSIDQNVTVKERLQPEVPEQQSKPASKHTIDDYSAMMSRPLFNKDRIPLEKTDTGDSEEDAKAFTLVGVVLTSEQQVAIIYSKNQNQPVKVPLWEWIDGWRLVTIEDHGVVLRKGSRSIELILQRASKAEAG